MTPVSASTLTLAPGTTTVPGTGANLDPDYRLNRSVRDYVHDRASSEGYWAWLDHVWPAAGCSNPVQLRGDLLTLNAATGEILSRRHTSTMPDGVLYKACGNRRGEVCPSCAEVYRRDAYQLIRAGLVGGRTITTDVAGHPAVFATFTAPSFGLVHTRVVRKHHCAHRSTCTCVSLPCHARREPAPCPHGIDLRCHRRHRVDDPELGRPLCLDCYDHDHQVVWNTLAGELWRRTRQAIERHAIQLARARGMPFQLVDDGDGRRRKLPPVRVSYAKAAEYQRRGVVHFHALLRLDGTDPVDPDALVPPPAGLDVQLLEDAITTAARATRFVSPDHPDHAGGWEIAWGRQLDVRPVKLGGGELTDSMVAGYLAKYATKSTETTGHLSRRLDAGTIRIYGNPAGTHTERLVAACWLLGRYDGWDQLQRWAHMLGFGGHFLTKARRYSITFGQLRQTRITWRRNNDAGTPAVRAVDHQDDETTLIVGNLSYAGSGWHTTGDAALANTAAALARERARVGREELDHATATAA